ncbi:MULTISPECIES: 23S rRNA (pseudouridine(1915)-N(3))-methyltransferase RlmH [Acidithiobacillus]|jgi:23S rRNA (pseudouridine1915-N3)-methyltransferase|uniref:Ribosomal RNA large subunit methyltransferase H n=1 Tax=Acidithiobacillus caldus (strain ATCC 51756 / DSM 8584 / KU) TaxID=637389 RepID=A0A060A2R1_ACICK|nr:MULTISPECIES: 23S rRNA (pseudouridine(1915)-N(3))-methyltransferase RlmH [Acidithiobacillus]AIA56511.1 LSU m3Psi1915 methyltransferase RlmH [Acidithiobacillus caldus ATCC 51756]AUW33831.1 23S rRNA (pseudouridine(1915)-N(3))-methyltransferase RlmH [Acidithiobacillus caldus]MBU2730590.1 23S rRNA (pseudouridine(1915)-N(3))-methyltransferase RlmH [Acidithiobacillus caldus]MBU2735563.1 23S rRNA (pseudouridine(1915)-N(3))-methyltransferase RlmH [Acidithiobacillus caldus ATCC 51756]MBU2745291.1 23
MRVQVLALGTRMPRWVQEAVAEYSARIPPPLRPMWQSLPLASRRPGGSVARWRAEEGRRLRAATPQGAEVIALDVRGRALGSEELAQRLEDWRERGQDLVFWIGGPDGLDPGLAPSWRWSLSPLTLAHPVVRVVLAEQWYRAWSIQAGLPYHRGEKE